MSRILAICVALVTVLAVTAGAAWANPYAGAQQSNTNSGASATLEFKNLSTSNNLKYHSLDHLWVSDVPVGTTPIYWVEAGANIGKTLNNDYPSPVYDWDNQNVNGYFEHNWGQAPYNFYFTVQILYAGGGTWAVNDAGNTANATNASFSSSPYDLAFGETNDLTGGGKVCAHDSSLTWYDPNGVGHSGYGSLANSPPYISANWTSQPTAVRAYGDEPSNC